jgi:NAD(P)-dependent dehydrogenase (short-subunit alcohol dehydrogenase family)
MAPAVQAATRRRVAIVTGASGAIGKAIAHELARQGLAVVMVGRDAGRIEGAAAEVRRAVAAAGPAGPEARAEVVDLGRRREIEDFAARWRGRLDVLVNNAATTPRRREETPEGIERQLATNVLGYFWMTRAFEAALAASAPARVVNVASYWAGDLDLDDLELRRRRYDNNTAYRQSKQADRMLAAAFAPRLRASGVTVNACHPGDVDSALSNALGFGGSEAPEEGADTPAWLATDPSVAEITGAYFAHRRGERCRFAADEAAVEALFRICERY